MIALLLLILLLPILLAPLETAGWWSRRRVEPIVHLNKKALGSKPALQLVYFTGVAGYSGDFLARREKALLSLVQEQFTDLKIHHDVFPYSASNLPLDGERVFRALWIWLHRWRLKVPNNVFDALIVIRNTQPNTQCARGMPHTTGTITYVHNVLHGATWVCGRRDRHPDSSTNQTDWRRPNPH